MKKRLVASTLAIAALLAALTGCATGSSPEDPVNPSIVYVNFDGSTLKCFRYDRSLVCPPVQS